MPTREAHHIAVPNLISHYGSSFTRNFDASAAIAALSMPARPDRGSRPRSSELTGTGTERLFSASSPQRCARQSPAHNNQRYVLAYACNDPEFPQGNGPIRPMGVSRTTIRVPRRLCFDKHRWHLLTPGDFTRTACATDRREAVFDAQTLVQLRSEVVELVRQLQRAGQLGGRRFGVALVPRRAGRSQHPLELVRQPLLGGVEHPAAGIDRFGNLPGG